MGFVVIIVVQQYMVISRTKTVLRLNRLRVFVHLEYLLMRFTHVGSPLGIKPYGGGGDGDGGVGLLDNPGGSKRILFVRIVVVRPLVVGMLRHVTRYRKQHDVFTPKVVDNDTGQRSLSGFLFFFVFFQTSKDLFVTFDGIPHERA
jgi:hypothetical protein